MSTPPVTVTAEIHGFSEPGAEPVSWPDGLEHVIQADTFWLSTVRPDGRPHVTPLIGVWHGDALWFATGPQERKAENLARNQACVLTAGCGDLAEGGLDVMIEGAAEQVTDEAELRPVAEAFGEKYGRQMWDFVVQDGAFAHRGVGGRVLVFRVRPSRALGFRKGDAFSQTTWRFER
jgi:hypothetical protein